MADDHPPKPAAQAGDPSMEDILASIRRILSEDETGPGSPEPRGRNDKSDDVFDLDASMMIPEERPPVPKPPAAAPVVKPAPAVSDPAPVPPPAAAVASTEPAKARAPSPPDLRVHEGGPTLESLVREALRPLLREWLDAHLPAMVERLYRAERVGGPSPN